MRNADGIVVDEEEGVVTRDCCGGHLKVVKFSLTETKLYALQTHDFRFKEGVVCDTD